MSDRPGIGEVMSRRVLPRAVVAESRVDGFARLAAASRRRLGRHGRVELFFSFDDPSSAVAVLDLTERLRHHDAQVILLPVVDRGIPGDPAVELKRRYALTDAGRLAQRLDLALARAEPWDPVVPGVLAEWVAAAPQGPALTRFCEEAMRRLWFDVEGRGRPTELGALWRTELGDDAPRLDGARHVRRNSRRMRLRGIYDVPAAWVHGQWFFAHDRRRTDRGALGRSGLGRGGMTARIEFFYSFRSPYSYLAAPRAFALPGRFDVQILFRGVIPMAMRGQAVPRAKRLHTLRDAAREATRLGMPFGRIHDPIGRGAVRCLLVAEHALAVGREREFVLEAGRAIWSEATDVSRDPGLRVVCERAGLSWDDCAVAIDNELLLNRVRANTEALVRLGHWGVPVFVFETEMFWGQDRIGDLESTLQRVGLDR